MRRRRTASPADEPQHRRRRRVTRWQMTVAWLSMGVLVTVGFFALRYDSYRRCQASNDFRTVELPTAFKVHDDHLGEALGASQERIDEFEAGFRADLEKILPERKCSLW
jgi:hypothetical protein